METLEVAESREPIRIGGWLIIVALGIVISPIRVLHLLGTTFPPIFTDGTWEALTTPGSEAYSPVWGPLLISEIIVNLIMVLFGLYLAYLFFTRKKGVPIWYFGLALFSSVFIIIDAYLVTLVIPSMEVFDVETIKELGRSLVSLLIWSPYLIYSKRSKETFVNVRK